MEVLIRQVEDRVACCGRGGPFFFDKSRLFHLRRRRDTFEGFWWDETTWMTPRIDLPLSFLGGGQPGTEPRAAFGTPTKDLP